MSLGLIPIVIAVLILSALGLYMLYDRMDFKRSTKNFHQILSAHLSHHNKLEAMGLTNNLKVHFKWREDKKRAFNAMLHEYMDAKNCKAFLFVFKKKGNRKLQEMEKSLAFYFPHLSKKVF